MHQLESLGYLTGRQEAPPQRGVTVLRRELVAPGFNLYTSGHASEAVLMDPEGEVVHRWQYAFEEIWPDKALERFYEPAGGERDYFRHAHLYPNGDLLAIFEGLGLIKLDKDSRLLWQSFNRAHHDLHVMADGRIFVLTREAGIIPRIHPQRPMFEDFISELSADGREIRRISLLRALEVSAWAGELAWRSDGDLFHTNTVEVLERDFTELGEAFVEGTALVSLPNLSAVGLVDLEAERFVWWRTGDWVFQHHPTLLAGGTLLLFDNLGAGQTSRVVEMSVPSMERIWAYGRDPTESFFTVDCGYSERLANGNTLITSSNEGRAFEVTPDGGLVWEFFSPHRAGREQRLIATLFEVQRIPPERLRWLR